MSTIDSESSSSSNDQALKAPSISLPKGGGAIRGMGEKFASNPVTGTGSMNVPIALSPGRSGFGPELSLSYDSGAGQGPFGFGWNFSLPTITRKTDKGLPKYLDAIESDDFILSGAEDLVPVLKENGSRYEDPVTVEGYVVHRYRPRIEGLFALIERWTRKEDGDTHWRSISRDNILTIYGKDSDSRIFDPSAPERIFSWLISETRDDKGNAILYEYKAENGTGVDLACAQERNRGGRLDLSRSANRYLGRIRYGNRSPLLDEKGRRPRFLTTNQIDHTEWLFEAVFDYGEYDLADPKPNEAGDWPCRLDPFSSYRAGFEVRTYRLCHRILMFHHFPAELDVGNDCLVRSTSFEYDQSPVASFLTKVIQSGYKRSEAGGYHQQSLPALEFEYSRPVIGQEIKEIDSGSMNNLPAGVDGAVYQWVDLDGDGLTGILSEQGGGWFYKRNESALTRDQVTDTFTARLAPAEQVALIPAGTSPGKGGWQFLDLAGDGQPDLVSFDTPLRGFYERDGELGWASFRAFSSNPNIAWSDPSLKFIDLTGDGHADLLLSEDQALTWYPSLAEEGFGQAVRVNVPTDEERGPRVVFDDGTQAVLLADLSGDGLTDIVRIRNGEVCYWPNLGYGKFGAKVTMGESPWFDASEQFDPRRIRLADIDGSGVTDIIYLGRNETRLWFNHSGNAWSQAHELHGFPSVDNIASVAAVDLLGNGTACLVWSSPLPGESRAPMKYLSLMAEGKPHLLISSRNNLGAETRVNYAPSTYFYLKDKYDGNPWITKLPFPVHVVERVETIDRISRNRFVSRYAYHHGYFDGTEREFRGFGMVEQWDTETFAALGGSGHYSIGENIDEASHVPPVLTKTWFHTGAMATLLTGAEFPAGMTPEEEREAYRSLKGSMLRQEVYAIDGSDKEEYPYTVTEQSYSVRRLQERSGNRYGVFFTHPRETMNYNYERNLADPRISHTMILETDDFGNVLKQAAIGYGRLQADPKLLAEDQAKQMQTLITYTENRFTDTIDDQILFPNAYRAPLPCESRTYELTGYEPTGEDGRFQSSDFVRDAAIGFEHIFDGDLDYEEPVTNGLKQRRLIEHVRTIYRRDDLSALYALGKMGALALPGEKYKLAFTPGLIEKVYRRDGQSLMPLPGDILGGTGADRGGYVPSQNLKAANVFPSSDRDDYWWIPAGRVYLSPRSVDTAVQELAYARRHFYLPCRYRDPFHTSLVSTETVVTYDKYDLLMLDIQDPLGNRVTVGERLPNGEIDVDKSSNDYRVLQPKLEMDPNRNRTEVAFDILGMVVGTAVMGKPEENLGDSLDGFVTDLSELDARGHLADPLANPHSILGRATTRVVYDLFAYQRTKDEAVPQPAVSYAMVREKHESDLVPGERTKLQINFTYSDGFGREIQKKAQAEPEKADDGVGLTRWVGSGWTIFNNKGKPIRHYEPYYSATHDFEFGVEIGVSPVLFYDPIGRVVATLHPNHTYEKVVFDPWRQSTYDGNDTVAPHGLETGDPRTDPDIKGYVARYFELFDPINPWQTWYEQRKDGALGTQEKAAADKAACHANTPTTVYFDTLGRPFLTKAHNGFKDNTAILFDSRVELDIEGNQRVVRDAIVQDGDKLGRIVMRYSYDLLGNRIFQASMEAGERWILGDAAGNPIRVWDSMGRIYRNDFDPLRRPLRIYVVGADPNSSNEELLTERIVYGEQHPEAELRGLRGKLYLHLDQAGAASCEAYDYKGNLLKASRRLAKQYKQAIRWHLVDAVLPTNSSNRIDAASLEAVLAPLLEADLFINGTTYDALNRPVTKTTPSTSNLRSSVIRFGFNEGGLLERVDADLCGDRVSGQPIWTPFVVNIDYDAKGQRQRIDYGNGVSTMYQYDPLTLRLTKLRTSRNAVSYPDDNPNPPLSGWPGCHVQNLTYTYDPAGNIVHIRDKAQQGVYFRNKYVDPSAEYTYDALYRLIEATGREHLGQAGGIPIQHSHNDGDRIGIQWSSNDGNAMGRYVENYVYDEVGNFLMMQHRNSDLAVPGWTRHYAYEETSLVENGVGGTQLKYGNRLSSTTVSGNVPVVERYMYDAHGNMTRMPHLGGADPGANMHWNYRDQLRQTDLGGGGTAYYVYDSAGQRVRKVWEKSASLIEERIYLGGFEIFRKRNESEGLLFERGTLHIMDDKQRIAMVERRSLDMSGKDPAPEQLIRYQFGNHLGSASLELDEEGSIISYEEYTPYGSSSYQAVRSQSETPKRYRYTGKERDEESGLYYHGARYYAPWLGRWTATDPAGMVEGTNVYAFVSNNPINRSDPAGYQSHDAQELMMGMMWKQMGRELSAMITGVFGGSAHVSPAENKVEYSAPKEGVGGVVGGVVRAGTLRAVPIERNPTPSSLMGMEVGAGFVPVLDSGARLVTGNTVTGQDTSRVWAAVQFGLDVLPIAFELRAMRIEARTMSVAAESAEASVSIAFRPGLVENPGPIGHNMVGVNTGSGTKWSHLVIADSEMLKETSGIVTSGDALVVSSRGPKPGDIVIKIPVTKADAAKAAAVAESKLATQEVGQYSLFRQDCTTYSGEVLNAAGISTPAVSTPALNALSVALQSPAAVIPFRAAAAGTLISSAAVRVTRLEEEMQMSIPSEH